MTQSQHSEADDAKVVTGSVASNSIVVNARSANVSSHVASDGAQRVTELLLQAHRALLLRLTVQRTLFRLIVVGELMLLLCATGRERILESSVSLSLGLLVSVGTILAWWESDTSIYKETLLIERDLARENFRYSNWEDRYLEMRLDRDRRRGAFIFPDGVRAQIEYLIWGLLVILTFVGRFVVRA